jgi:hypothetical protein
MKRFINQMKYGYMVPDGVVTDDIAKHFDMGHPDYPRPTYYPLPTKHVSTPKKAREF